MHGQKLSFVHFPDRCLVQRNFADVKSTALTAVKTYGKRVLQFLISLHSYFDDDKLFSNFLIQNRSKTFSDLLAKFWKMFCQQRVFTKYVIYRSLLKINQPIFGITIKICFSYRLTILNYFWILLVESQFKSQIREFKTQFTIKTRIDFEFWIDYILNFKTTV